MAAAVLAASGTGVLVTGLAGSGDGAAAPSGPASLLLTDADALPHGRVGPLPVAAAEAPTSSSTAASTPSSTADIRVRIPSVGIDLPVLPLAPSGGAIHPPTMSDAYWIDSYGRPGSGKQAPDNTVYIAAHSWSHGDAAFNPLLAADHRGAAVAPGDVVEVATPSGTTTYRVADVRRYDKDELPSATRVWEIHPGRLVLITCFQRDDGLRSTQNLVVTAEAV